MVLCISSSITPPPAHPQPLRTLCCPLLDGSSTCNLAEGGDVGATTGGHYDTPASRPDGHVLWGGGTWNGEKRRERQT